MLERLRSRFKQPVPTGPTEAMRTFGSSDRTIAESGVSVDGNAWRIEAREAGLVPLFEVTEPGVENCVVTYRAELKSADVEGGAYLEMWCRVPGRGEFFSKGLDRKAKGTTGWSSHEVQFRLKEGERPDLLRLELAFEGSGTVWIRNVELLRTLLG